MLLVLVLASCTTSPTGQVTNQEQYTPVTVQPSGPQIYEMNISRFDFVPKELVINKGDRVVFTNNNGKRHKIAEATYRQFESPYLEVGQSFTHTFSRQGKVTVEILDFEQERDAQSRSAGGIRVQKQGVIQVR